MWRWDWVEGIFRVKKMLWRLIAIRYSFVSWGPRTAALSEEDAVGLFISTPSFLLCGFPCTLPALHWASLVSMRFHYRCSPVRPEDVGMWLPGINTSLQITPQKSLEKLWLWVPKHIKRQQKQEQKHFSGRRIFAAVCCFVSHKKSSSFNR